MGSRTPCSYPQRLGTSCPGGAHVELSACGQNGLVRGSADDRISLSKVVLMDVSKSCPPRCGQHCFRIFGHEQSSESCPSGIVHRLDPEIPQIFSGCPLSIHRLSFLDCGMRRVRHRAGGRRRSIWRHRTSTMSGPVVPRFVLAVIASRSVRRSVIPTGPVLARRHHLPRFTVTVRHAGLTARSVHPMISGAS